MIPRISFFASAIKPHLWVRLFDSLRNNYVPYEIVFAGFIEPFISDPILKDYPEVRYIETGNIKPVQAYEVARRACRGDLVAWIDDDHIFTKGFIDNIIEHWNRYCKCKTILTTEYTEIGTQEKIRNYRFYSRNMNTPQMPLVGIINREYLNRLGGIDSRYIIGRWNCDIAMRVLADGGNIEVCKEAHFTLDSKNKNGLYNNFWSGWNEDSEQLENSWVIDGYRRFEDELLVLSKDKVPYWYVPISNQEVTLKRQDEFSPFKDEDLLISSQKPYGHWFPRRKNV